MGERAGHLNFPLVVVTERSPKAFVKMNEEDLRQHFLVQLNGHFEGQATGETFNFEGKTDTLIRANEKNKFIAECMYWGGEKSLLKKIDQLLGHTSWRDTKTAILVFNRNVDFGSADSQISETARKHKDFKRQLDYKPGTGFRFVFHQSNDKNREPILTVLAFDIQREVICKYGRNRQNGHLSTKGFFQIRSRFPWPFDLHLLVVKVPNFCRSYQLEIT
jgi:hypothetical protein